MVYTLFWACPEARVRLSPFLAMLLKPVLRVSCGEVEFDDHTEAQVPAALVEVYVPVVMSTV